MKENFDVIMDHIFHWEGGYSNDPDDPGGETNFGISKRAHPDEDIAGMTKERAKEIYKRDYWNKLQLDTTPWPWDLVLMDTGVNMGVTAANQIFSKSRHWADFLFYRIEHYSRLPHAKKYLRGWINRIISLVMLIRHKLEEW